MAPTLCGRKGQQGNESQIHHYQQPQQDFQLHHRCQRQLNTGGSKWQWEKLNHKVRRPGAWQDDTAAVLLHRQL